MSKMYVANCTQQNQVFIYRLPESQRPFTIDIPIGGQVMLAGIGGRELSTKDVDAVVAQHAIYGMVNVDELDRTKPFVGVCYSIDKPISADKIRRGVDHNRGVLIERGQEIQEHAAVGIRNRIDAEMPGIKGLEATVAELDKPGQAGEFASAVRVDPKAPQAKPGRRK